MDLYKLQIIHIYEVGNTKSSLKCKILIKSDDFYVFLGSGWALRRIRGICGKSMGL